MSDNLRDILEKKSIEASAPCRIDMGGTLDIGTFHYPLRHLSPCTFNIAVNLRTQVRLLPYDKGMVKVTSRGFESVAFHIDNLPFSHPLGLVFAIAAYFRAEGIHIVIDSSSPPRSALGGSSAAAVALVAAFSKVFKKTGEPEISKKNTAVLAHAIEESVAGVPCGMQDQLAAVYGGIHAWYWTPHPKGPLYKKKKICKASDIKNIEQRILLAFCGVPHESKNVNGKWVQQFLSGKDRHFWFEIIRYTNMFIKDFEIKNYKMAAEAMNRETEIRRMMTPEVIDNVGIKLIDSAVKCGCGARFTGAGGGGCIWALGEVDDISKLRTKWKTRLLEVKEAGLLELKIDSKGLVVHDE